MPPFDENNPNKTTRGNAPPFSSKNQPEGRGRPKGSLGPTNHLKRLLRENKDKEAIAFSNAVINLAKKGNAPYAKMVFERADGLLKQEIEVTGLGDLGARLANALHKRKEYEKDQGGE